MSSHIGIDFARDRATSNWRHGYHLLPALINRLDLHVGVEVGVALGGHADAILTQCPGVHFLYAVDPYKHREGYDDPMNLPQEVFDAMYEDTAMFLERRGHCHIFRDASVDVAKFLRGDKYIWKPGTESALIVDFVYIDAEHTYEACKVDIVAWYPLIRDGGVLSGHDYGGFPGVTRAVDEFCAAMGLELHVEEHYFWWTVKK